jgi:hypothetical protein
MHHQQTCCAGIDSPIDQHCSFHPALVGMSTQSLQQQQTRDSAGQKAAELQKHGLASIDLLLLAYCCCWRTAAAGVLLLLACCCSCKG